MLNFHHYFTISEKRTQRLRHQIGGQQDQLREGDHQGNADEGGRNKRHQCGEHLADCNIHQIANAAQNPMLATITEYITRLTMPSRLETTRKVLAKGEEEIERFVELHRQLLSVIERRQVDEIVATVQDHYIFWKK